MPCFKARLSASVLLPCLLALAPARAQRPSDTLNVYFGLDVAVLAPPATRYLDSLVYSGVLQRGSSVALIGYTDYLGSTGYNDTLSLRRARAVKSYLQQIGFRDSDIRLLLARGEVPRPDQNSREGFAPDRRVDIVVAQRPPRLQRPSLPGRQRDTPRVSAFTATFEPAPPPRPRPPVRRADTPAKSLRRLQGTLVIKPAPPPHTDFSGLTRADSSTTVRIDNLYFPAGIHTPYSTSFAELDRLFQALKGSPTLRIRVEGHVCCINGALVPDAFDEETADYRLSVNRARFITEYLIRKGIAPERLEYVGFGKTRPVVPVEVTADDGNKNRRVEIRVLSR